MYKTLETIRAKMLDAEKLNEQIARISVAYKAPSLDGMPKGGSGNAMETRIIAKEFIEARRDALVREIRELEGKARKAIENLPAHLYAFCITYFLAACSEEETCRIIDRDKSTLYRYKREVKKMLGE